MGSIVITPLYAGLLGILLVVLSVRIVIAVRVGGKISLGDGNNSAFTPIIRAQGNFIEYVPLALLLIAFAEFNGAPGNWIHILGGVLVVSRILHPLELRSEHGITVTRVLGAAGTWLVLLGAAALCIRAYLTAAS